MWIFCFLLIASNNQAAYRDIGPNKHRTLESIGGSCHDNIPGCQVGYFVWESIIKMLSSQANARLLYNQKKKGCLTMFEETSTSKNH
jgi:hypothetical protein